ncbi:hypothetical protein CMK14_14965 [Candidatus Poribacteria bacterium]|nr:hypothetical protein [Candidatus Poribacteria bacterium]
MLRWQDSSKQNSNPVFASGIGFLIHQRESNFCGKGRVEFWFRKMPRLASSPHGIFSTTYLIFESKIVIDSLTLDNRLTRLVPGSPI